MYCKECGKEIDNDSRFCSYCGTEQSELHFSDLRSTTNSKSESQPQKIDISLPTGEIDKRETKENVHTEKYDKDYQGDIGATIFGSVLIIINLIILLTVRIEDPYDLQTYKAIAALVNIVWRIIATIWVVNIAKRQNRNQNAWGLFAFFIPNLALIIIGLLKKLIKSNTLFSSTIQATNSQKSDTKSKADSTSDVIEIGEKSEPIEYSITNIDTITHSFFKDQTEYRIEYSNSIYGSVYTYDSKLFFIIHKDNTKYYYRNKKSAIKALYQYLTNNQIQIEELAYSG